MILIRAQLQKAYPRHSALDHIRSLTTDEGIIVVEAESTRLFDVCNAFVDAVRDIPPNAISATDAAVFSLIKDGRIPQVPTLKRGEIMEFIQKIAFALSSVSRLAILRELHARPMMRATVAILEMVTGIANQTLRRHLMVLINCRLITRTRIGQTFLYEGLPMRLATLTYLWNALNMREA